MWFKVNNKKKKDLSDMICATGLVAVVKFTPKQKKSNSFSWIVG